MKPLVSVITPAYNAAHTLRACIESIRSQTYSDWEHIVVDDGSTDGTWRVLQTLASEDERLRVVWQANAGQGAARNAAIRMAQGEYIALLDADDRALTERLATQVAFLDAYPEVDVLGGAIINVTETGEELGIERLPAEHDILARSIYWICPFFTSTVMARRIFLEATGGFAEDLPRAQDYDLWFRGYHRFKYYNLGIPFAYYLCDTKLRWRNVYYSAKVILRAARREGKVLSHFWYVLRPLLAYGAQCLGYRK